MNKLSSLTTHISETNHAKMWQFLEEYNKRTGKNLSMSELIWIAIKKFVTETMKSWKG